MIKNKSNIEKVRKVTSSKKNSKIDALILANIKKYGAKSSAEISERIEELDKEWEIEKALNLNMAVVALMGITSSYLINPYAIILTIILLLFFIQHVFQGWCPPITILRHFKVRTRPEIDREKYALKAIRGDFDRIPKTPKDVFDAVRKS
jgi:hypothetical protein